MILNCIAVDDEPPALSVLDIFIRQTPFLNLQASFSNALDALKFLNENPVDLIFLDIQMPDLSGVELTRILAGRHANQTAKIIFTTAFEQFALEGYRLDILDYLLKPFSFEDFYRASTKALNQAQLAQNIGNRKTKEEAYLYLKIEFHTVKVPCDNILYIEGLKDYVKVHLADNSKSLLSIITLKSMEEKLPKSQFMRIHRSYIVSLDKITAVTKNSVQIGNVMIVVTEQYKEAFTAFLSTWT